MIATHVRFRIQFESPFLVSTGRAKAGYDATPDDEVPLPATAIKGLMRAQAREVLGVGEPWENLTYGAPRRPSHWAWSDARFDADPQIAPASRVSVGNRGVKRTGFLAITQVLWADSAEFVVALTDSRASDLAEQCVVLRASALSISSLGSNRRRGHGWVQVTEIKEEGRVVPWTDEDSRALLGLRLVWA